MDVQGGRISAGSPGGDGGGDEHPGECADVWPAPGHRAQDASLLPYSVPPGYRRQSPPRKPKLEPFTSVIDRILEDDLRRPRKQRHTVKRIFERLRDEYGFDGQYTIVKDYVREHRRQTKEMFVPLSHPPGHAQCDFGEALVVIGGIERKAHCFVLDLPHSDGCFVKAYPAETTEAFLDGHVSPSPSWAGCPRASSTTTPSWRWPGSWGMDAVNAPAPSPSCSLTTCSRTGSASQSISSGMVPYGLRKPLNKSGTTAFLCWNRA